MIDTRFLAATALVSLFATPALAQTPSDPPPAPAASASAGGAPADESEIVVTGLKRDESLLEVPVSVQVFNEKAIAQAGVTRPQDFLQLTPNVNFYSSINRSDFFVNIRGQSSIRGAEPSVRIIIDGVPVANPAEFTSELVDIQQIEVLRGPQSAFYGRNASAGAIVITTKAPSDEWSGQVTGGYGNWDSYRINGSFGGAILPGVLRIRATVAHNSTDGPFKNINTGVNEARYRETLGRLRAEWLVTEDFTLDARLFYQRAKGSSYSYLPQISRSGPTAADGSGTTVGGRRVTAVNTDDLDIPYVSDVKGILDQRIVSTSLKADWDFGPVKLTSLSSYAALYLITGGKNLPYGNRNDPTTNFGAFAPIYGDQTQNNDDRYYQFDQELRLTSDDTGAFRWQFGGEYTWAKYRRYRNVALAGAIPPDRLGTPLGYNGFSVPPNETATRSTLLGPALLPPDPQQIYGLTTPYATRVYTVNDRIGKNYAVFANAQIDITEALELGLAGRYDIEKRSTRSIGTDARSPFNNLPYNQCVRILNLTLQQCIAGRRQTFKQFQPKATLTYKLPGFGSIFASYGKGFKTGGFNDIGTRELLVAARAAVVGRAAAEAQTFTQDFYDKEVSTNYELGFKAQLADRRVNISGAVFWTDVRNSQQYRFDPAAAVAAIDSIDKSRIKGFEFDVSARVVDPLTLFLGYGYIDNKIKSFVANRALQGNRVPYTAKYNLTAGAQLVQPLTDTLELTARGEFNRTGSTWFDIQNTPNTRRSPYNLVNGRLGVSNERFDIAFWGKNIFNKRYATEAVVLFPFVNVLGQGLTRSYGVEAKYRF